jgi:hypothetical protein
MLKTTLVPVEETKTVWNEVAPMLQRALDTTPGFYDIPSLFEVILSGQQHLWVVFDEEDAETDLIAAFTTMFMIYPLAKTLTVPFMGGDRMDEWFWEGFKVIDQFARHNNCHGIEAYGRKGWEKWLGEGWKPMHSFLKVLE